MGNSMHKDTKQRVATSRTQGQTHTQANREEKEQHSAQPLVHVSPVMRIYRHALESIFAMLDLDDLSRVLAVSREWAAAVRSMKLIHASMERDYTGWLCRRYHRFPPISRIVGSPLLRHLAALHLSDFRGAWIPLSNECLDLLAQHAPDLQSLAACCWSRRTSSSHR